LLLLSVDVVVVGVVVEVLMIYLRKFQAPNGIACLRSVATVAASGFIVNCCCGCCHGCDGIM